MIESISRHQRSEEQDYTFSVVIPTWNNLGYLKKCMESINRHSVRIHQIILFVNEGKDGTMEWLEEGEFKNVDYLHSPENLGICYGVNLARSMIKSDYLVYMNDDMYVLPGWDEELIKSIESLDSKEFMLSSTLIEPKATGNDCVVIKDLGSDLGSFQEEVLLDIFPDLKTSNWQGSTWPPVILRKELWDLVGGFSTEFSPGMYSDPDLTAKLMHAGVRIFMGVGSSLVYHFGSKSTHRVQKNRGHKMYIAKWGISARVFRKKLLLMSKNYKGPIPEPDLNLKNRLFYRLRRVLY
jgi:GT2 family glycosyltransferase